MVAKLATKQQLSLALLSSYLAANIFSYTDIQAFILTMSYFNNTKVPHAKCELNLRDLKMWFPAALSKLRFLREGDHYQEK